jgi:hypothetical protein
LGFPLDFILRFELRLAIAKCEFEFEFEFAIRRKTQTPPLLFETLSNRNPRQIATMIFTLLALFSASLVTAQLTDLVSTLVADG